ncbi:hypothetical protein NL676_013231 [Syzygium grande]|nr:hypothetical protein NL676_013231 [Syzygium grande]
MAVKPCAAMDRRDKGFAHDSKWPKRVPWHSNEAVVRASIGRSRGPSNADLVARTGVWGEDPRNGMKSTGFGTVIAAARPGDRRRGSVLGEKKSDSPSEKEDEEKRTGRAAHEFGKRAATEASVR